MKGNYNTQPISNLQLLFEKLLTPEISIPEFSALLEQLKPQHSKTFKEVTGGRTLFHAVFNNKSNQISEAKIRLIFAHAQRLELDPNAQWNPPSLGAQLKWNNSALHFYLSNELFDLAQSFLKAAHDYKFQINLNLQDREGKTPLLLAIKLGNVPLDLIKALTTPENYHRPDNTGVTPLMMACALRRVDIIQFIIQYHAAQLGLGTLNFTKLTVAQKQKLADFINQKDNKTGKALAHFAVMRHGTEKELLEKPDSYQLTVLNIAKSVGIDARRDKKATANSPVTDQGAPFFASDDEINFYHQMQRLGKLNFQHINIRMLSKFGLEKDKKQLGLVITHLTYYGNEKVENALLSTKENAYILTAKMLGHSAAFYTDLPRQIKDYSGTSYAESILERTEETITFLARIGHDFSLKQDLGNRTAAEYLANLTLKGNEFAVTSLDKKYLFPLEGYLKELANLASAEHSQKTAPAASTSM